MFALLCLLLVIASAAPSSSAPTPLLNYTAVVGSLYSGHNVRAIVNAQQCSFDKGAVPMPFVGGTTIPTFGILIENQTLVFDNTPMVTVPAFGLLLNNVHYSVHHDGSIEIVSTLIEPAGYRIISKSVLHCSLSPTADPVASVAFFAT